MVHVFSHLWRRLLSVFLAGLFAILPLVITVAIVSWVINFILQIVGSDTWIGRTLKSVGRSPWSPAGPSTSSLGSTRRSLLMSTV